MRDFFNFSFKGILFVPLGLVLGTALSIASFIEENPKVFGNPMVELEENAKAWKEKIQKLWPLSKEPPAEIKKDAALPSSQQDTPSSTKPMMQEEEDHALRELHTGKARLQEEARSLMMKKEKLKLLESLLQQKHIQLQKLMQTLEEKTKLSRRIEGENLARLIKIYETMEPTQAARILEASKNLKMAVQIISLMKESSAAAILASMQPIGAATITQEIVNHLKVSLNSRP